MTIHEKLDEIMSKVVLSNDYFTIDGRTHGAAGGTYYHEYTLNNVSQYSHLLIFLVGFSNVSGAGVSLSSTQDYMQLFTYSGSTNGGTTMACGLYMIPKPKNGIVIAVNTSASAFEKILGI